MGDFGHDDRRLGNPQKQGRQAAGASGHRVHPHWAGPNVLPVSNWQRRCWRATHWARLAARAEGFWATAPDGAVAFGQS